MRIVHVITRLNQGGTARWLDVLVSEQERRGHSAIVLAGEVQGVEAEDELAAHLPVIKVPALGRQIKPAQDTRAAWALARHFWKLRPDLINTHTSKAGALARAANLWLGPRRPTLVHTIHGHLLTGFAGPAGTFLIRETERALGAVSDSIICVGPIAYEGVTTAGIGRGCPVVDILPGARELTLPSRAEARAQLGLDEKEYAVAWVGRLTRQKNPERALETARRMPDSIWLVAGDGDMLGDLKAIAPDNVRLLGWSNPALILAAADVYVHTADWEGFPYSVIEALQAGLRVVATDAVHPGPGIIRVDSSSPGVPDRIAMALESVREAGPEPNDVRRGRAALFTPDTFGEAHEAVYAAAQRRREKT